MTPDELVQTLDRIGTGAGQQNYGGTVRESLRVSQEAYNAAAAARDAAARVEAGLAHLAGGTVQPQPLTVDDVLAAIGRASDTRALLAIVTAASSPGSAPCCQPPHPPPDEELHAPARP
ncbi:hypothetical protein FDG2_0721 [Candidatus Protofrankia californiensis]|uniref:Uncharacterized protein n=1 Tax=Candidatus Protofrankia californiensis TaxID=1839754 RepID=A0A1C3NU73_9ACTN|nr:hypothetical protein FDG2_0721 [Candidatus Protofrankia californiensis]